MAALTDVSVPDIGDFDDVPVVEILVAVGDTVAKEDSLVVLESEKATMEVPSPAAGTVKEVLVAVGDKVKEGTLLLTLTTEESAPQNTDAGADAPEPPAIYASPMVRKRARELGIDLASVTGTGRGGRIQASDLRSAADTAKPIVPGGASAGDANAILGFPLAKWPTPDFSKQGPTERVELSKIRRLSAANLHRNWVAIPHVTHHDEADITDLEAFRKRVNAEQAKVEGGAKVTMVALLMKACVASLKAFPDMNSSLDGDSLILKRYYHLGFAADTPNGLVVPVIRDVDQKGVLDIARDLTELSGKARAGKLTPKEMSGSTFTISSLGGIGGTAFTPIVNAPEVGILGVTRSATKPVWDGSQFVPRLMVPLSLSYDHRVIDGAAAARFCVHLAQTLTDLRRVLL